MGGREPTGHDGRRQNRARSCQAGSANPPVSAGRDQARSGESVSSQRPPRRASDDATRTKGLLLVAAYLLAWAATASAECAWVFWLEAGDARTHESSSRPISGWGTREACEQALTQKLASDSERDTEMDVTVDRQAGRPRLWVRRKGHSEPLAVYSYVCLPDTVDPRGPKGR